MTVPWQMGLAFGSVAVLVGLMAAVRRAAQAGGLDAEVQRKLIHVGTGLYALTLPWLFPDRWPVYLLLAITLVVMTVLRLPQLTGGLGAALHGVARRSYGDYLLAIAVGLCFFLSNGEPLTYVLPIAVLTLADAAAALAGTAYGTRHFQVEEGAKSIEGSVVFFVVTVLVSMTCLMFFSDLPPANILALSLMVAGFGTLVEAQSWRGFDNLFLPLGLYLFLALHTGNTLGELAALAAIFLTAILGGLLVGPRIGLTFHASRVYVVAMFLILSVTYAQNAILPGLVLLTHAWASLAAPPRDAHGELDVVAGLALISFGWLALGEAAGQNAVLFYGLTAMGLAAGLAAIALRARPLPALATAVGLVALREGIAALNPPVATWAEPLWPLALLCVLSTTIPVLAAPAAFAGDRVLRLALLAVVLPLGTYLYFVFGAPLASLIGGEMP